MALPITGLPLAKKKVHFFTNHIEAWLLYLAYQVQPNNRQKHKKKKAMVMLGIEPRTFRLLV